MIPFPPTDEDELVSFKIEDDPVLKWIKRRTTESKKSKEESKKKSSSRGSDENLGEIIGQARDLQSVNAS